MLTRIVYHSWITSYQRPVDDNGILHHGNSLALWINVDVEWWRSILLHRRNDSKSLQCERDGFHEREEVCCGKIVWDCVVPGIALDSCESRLDCALPRYTRSIHLWLPWCVIRWFLCNGLWIFPVVIFSPPVDVPSPLARLACQYLLHLIFHSFQTARMSPIAGESFECFHCDLIIQCSMIISFRNDFSHGGISLTFRYTHSVRISSRPPRTPCSKRCWSAFVSLGRRRRRSHDLFHQSFLSGVFWWTCSFPWASWIPFTQEWRSTHAKETQGYSRFD